MRETYLQLAMRSGGVVTMVHKLQGFIATMNWPSLACVPIKGQPSNTVIDAMQSLNDALEDDAADEMP